MEENNIINISVKEIIEELSNYTGIDETNIGIFKNIQIGYWGTHSLDKLIKLINSEEQKLAFYPYKKDKYFTVSIFSKKNLHSKDIEQKFSYELKFKLDLDEIQANGKTLQENCREQLYFVDGPDMYCTGIVIDNIEDLYYKVNLDELENTKDSENFYPNELFKQVIINIIEKRNNKKILK